MNKKVFDVICGIYSNGDLQGIRGHLLHSTAWQQGLFTAYGESQHTRLWLNWLTQCGVSDIQKVCQVDSGAGESALLLEMKPSKSTRPVRTLFYLEHNDKHIKELDMSVDTSMLKAGLDMEQEAFSRWWPEPDPIIISDYDQQLHPKTHHASPKDLLAGQSEHLTALNQWWDIWQLIQLSNIWQLYGDDSEVYFPGDEQSKSVNGLFDFISRLLNQLSRHYCQLEGIIQDTEKRNQFAIKWYLEGDLRSGKEVKKVRLAFKSFIALQDGKIATEYLVFDRVAFDKQFPDNQLRLC